MPSTRARTKPALRISSSTAWWVPLRPRTSGDRISRRVPAGRRSTASTISWADWRDHLAPADRAVGDAGAGEEQAQVVVDLGHRADGGARVVRGALLVDGDGRGEAFDVIHIRLVHLPEELAGVGRERLDVAALAFGEDGIEGQRGFARTGQPGDDDKLVARDLDGDILQVVVARADDADDVLRHGS